MIVRSSRRKALIIGTGARRVPFWPGAAPTGSYGRARPGDVVSGTHLSHIALGLPRLSRGACGAASCRARSHVAEGCGRRWAPPSCHGPPWGLRGELDGALTTLFGALIDVHVLFRTLGSAGGGGGGEMEMVPPSPRSGPLTVRFGGARRCER